LVYCLHLCGDQARGVTILGRLVSEDSSSHRMCDFVKDGRVARVGIEARRERPWAKAWLFRRFRFTCPFSLFHSPVSVRPRVIPDGRISRVRFATIAVHVRSSPSRRGLSAHSHAPGRAHVITAVPENFLPERIAEKLATRRDYVAVINGAVVATGSLLGNFLNLFRAASRLSFSKAPLSHR
jgi:hypothetical protein